MWYSVLHNIHSWIQMDPQILFVLCKHVIDFFPDSPEVVNKNGFILANIENQMEIQMNLEGSSSFIYSSHNCIFFNIIQLVTWSRFTEK